jgi:FkbM family methyltransferase
MTTAGTDLPTPSFKPKRRTIMRRITVLAKLLCKFPRLTLSAFLNEARGKSTIFVFGQEVDGKPGKPRFLLVIFAQLRKRLKTILEKTRGRPIKTIVDCGAHVGLMSLMARHYFPSAAITAIEANPWNYELCKKNCEHLSIDVRHRALRGAGGSTSFYCKQGSFDQAGTIDRMYASDDQVEVDVTILTLGQLVQELGAIDILKLDIEGAEHEILNDLCRFAAQIGLVAVELHYLSSNREKVLSDLEKLGRVFSIEEPDFQYDGRDRYACDLILRSKCYD